MKEPYNTVFYRQTHANRKLNDLNHTLELVTQIHEIINSDFELDNLFEKIVNILIKKEDYQMAFIGKYLKENSRIRVKSSVGISSGFLKNKALDVNNENNAITQAVYRRKIIKDHNPQAVLNIFNKTDNNIHNSLIALPIYYNDTIYGVLAITSYKQDAFNKRVVELMKKTTQNLGLAITRYYTQKKIRYLSFHDQLTGLYNRNFFSEEIKRLDTSRKIPISIIVSDFNDLKYINDTYGHKVGDKFLKTYAEILQNNSRKEDIIARWGGDEFVILLPKTNQKITENLLDRIKESVSKVKIKGEELSIAWGYAIKDSEEQDIEEIFKKADEIMYENKKLIKNNNRENQI
ncbi:MAG: sensor domain-containing diguanylate cyclase [Halanaerobiales bacterium]